MIRDRLPFALVAISMILLAGSFIFGPVNITEVIILVIIALAIVCVNLAWVSR